jgi:hypothetical protein
MMVSAGLKYRIKEGGDADDRSSWYWNGSVAEENSKITIGQNLLAPMGMAHLPVTDYMISEIGEANYVRRIALAETTPVDVQYGYPMVDEIAAGTRAVPGETTNTWCNRVSYRTDVALLGTEAADRLVTERGIGYTNANSMGRILGENFTSVEGWEVQDAANRGDVGKVSFINPDPEGRGHIATVVASYGTFIPALGPKVAQGGMTNGVMWANKGFGDDLKVSKNYVISQASASRSNSIKRYLAQSLTRLYENSRR